MLKKIIKIQNVGRFKNSAAAGSSQLAKITLINGANGFGKTTLCAVFRSLQSNDSSHIIGRKTLGVAEQPKVDLLFPTGNIRFDGSTWSSPYPNIAIFDSVFVSENVHSGDVVELHHKRNLYRVIIGEAGIRLAEEDTRLAEESRAKTGEISGIAKAIQSHTSVGTTVNQFINLPFDPDIEIKINEQKLTVEAARKAETIIRRPGFLEFFIPTLPEGFEALLSRTIDDVAQDAEAKLVEHLAKHSMDKDGGNWIAQGLDHTDKNTCPFCGQDIRSLPLIAAYRAVFSKDYKKLRTDIAAMRATITQFFGERALGQLETLTEQNNSAEEYWMHYCNFDLAPLNLTQEIISAVQKIGEMALALLEKKDSKPLEVVPLDAIFITAIEAYKATQIKASDILAAIRSANTTIVAKKGEVNKVNLKDAELALTRLQTIKNRHSELVTSLCAEHIKLTAEKKHIDTQKNKIRELLDQHTNNVVEPYEKIINNYLDAFNAGFRITKTGHSYPGGKATSSYQLVINETAIDVGDGQTPPDQPSFKNTLSSGDRTTLALAFFLAHLDNDQALASKIVVFDDPFNSQDAFRRRQTVHEITKVANRCAQVIVLSHDATFLKLIWDKASVADRVSLTIGDQRQQGSKIFPLDLEEACKGRTACDIDDLQKYVSSGDGNVRDLIRKMRCILETHCWTSYPGYFLTGQDWLGTILKKIREGKDQHPAACIYDDLDQINDYTSPFYHGEELAEITPDQIDQTELTGFIKRTLRIANATQA